jgi:hypothetical protein
MKLCLKKLFINTKIPLRKDPYHRRERLSERTRTAPLNIHLMRVNIACVVVPRDVAFPVTAGKRERVTASLLPANTGRRSYLSLPSLILSPLWNFLLLWWKNKKATSHSLLLLILYHLCNKYNTIYCMLNLRIRYCISPFFSKHLSTEHPLLDYKILTEMAKNLFSL